MSKKKKEKKEKGRLRREQDEKDCYIEVDCREKAKYFPSTSNHIYFQREDKMNDIHAQNDISSYYHNHKTITHPTRENCRRTSEKLGTQILIKLSDKY